MDDLTRGKIHHVERYTTQYTEFFRRIKDSTLAESDTPRSMRNSFVQTKYSTLCRVRYSAPSIPNSYTQNSTRRHTFHLKVVLLNLIILQLSLLITVLASSSLDGIGQWYPHNIKIYLD